MEFRKYYFFFPSTNKENIRHQNKSQIIYIVTFFTCYTERRNCLLSTCAYIHINYWIEYMFGIVITLYIYINNLIKKKYWQGKGRSIVFLHIPICVLIVHIFYFMTYFLKIKIKPEIRLVTPQNACHLLIWF